MRAMPFAPVATVFLATLLAAYPAGAAVAALQSPPKQQSPDKT
jgi:hypothetical protein